MLNRTLLCLLSAAFAVGCDSGSPTPAGSDGSTTRADAGPRPQPMTMCTDTCLYARDGDCDDGGPSSDTASCALGTDCADCGPRNGNGTCTPNCNDRQCGSDGCGGTCGSCDSGQNCTDDGRCMSGQQTGCDPNAAPRCDGNVAVRCERVGGTNATVRESCGGTCRNGRCEAPTRPTRITIEGDFDGPQDPIVTNTDDGPYAFLSIVAMPRFDPMPHEMPNLFDAPSYRIRRPSLSGCTLGQANFSLNSTQVGGQFGGSGACVAFLTTVGRSGIEIEFEDVPYPNGGTVDVILELSP